MQTLSEFMLQKSGSMLQCRKGFVTIMLFVEDRDEDLGVTHVLADLHRGYGYHAQTRILEFLLDHLGELALKLFGYAPGAFKVFWHVFSGCLKLLERTGYLYAFVYFDLVAFLDIVVILYPDATLQTLLDLVDVVLETAQGLEFTFIDHHIIA